MDSDQKTSPENPWFFLAKSTAVVLALGVLAECTSSSRAGRKKAKRETRGDLYCKECGNDELGLVMSHRKSRNDEAGIDPLCPVHEAKRHFDAAFDGRDNGLTAKQNYDAAKGQAAQLDENGKRWLKFFFGRKIRKVLDTRRSREQ